MQRLRLLNHYFFQELGFAGNVNDYYDPQQQLPALACCRRGAASRSRWRCSTSRSPAQIGLQASGVSFPGHFLVKLRMPQGEVVIDPFTGQSLSREELDDAARAVPRAGTALPGDAPRAARPVPAGGDAARRSSRACCAT